MSNLKWSEAQQGSFRVLSPKPLDPTVVSKLIELSHVEPVPVNSVLGGRASLINGELPEVGKIVLKSYKRGGVFRRILPSVSFCVSPKLICPLDDEFPGSSCKLRALREMQALRSLSHFGLRLPTPIAVIIRGQHICKEWLVMEELPPHRSLAEISMENPEILEQFMPEVIAQIEALIEQRIWHVDLHPGNVLVADGLGVVLIDFDHARQMTFSKAEFRDRYLRRWRRAVIKHRLPDELSELLCVGLRRRSGAAPAVQKDPKLESCSG